jgi:hypothetical protein
VWLSLFTEALIAILDVPSKETAVAVMSPVMSIVRALANAVAVEALPVTAPVTAPVTLPVKLPSNVPATNVSLPTPHLSVDSVQTNDLLVDVPRSIVIPASWLGVPVSSELSVIMLSPMFTVLEFTVVVVPFTVKLPPTITSSNVTSW